MDTALLILDRISPCESRKIGFFRLLFLVIAGFLLLSNTGLAASRTAIAGDLSVNSEVEGDVLVLGGELNLGPAAHIHGDAIAIFGRVNRDPAARIDGRVLHLEDLASLDPQFENQSQTRLSIFLLTAGFWLLVTSLIGAFLQKRLGRALYQLKILNWRILPFAILAQLTLMGALIATLGLGPRFAAPITGMVLGISLILKALGLSLLGWFLGAHILPVSPKIPVNAEIFVGVLIFNLLRLLPGIGSLCWILISVLALGSGILTLGATFRSALAVEMKA